MKDRKRLIVLAVILILAAAAIILIAVGQKPAADNAEEQSAPIEI